MSEELQNEPSSIADRNRLAQEGEEAWIRVLTADHRQPAPATMKAAAASSRGPPPSRDERCAANVAMSMSDREMMVLTAKMQMVEEEQPFPQCLASEDRSIVFFKMEDVLRSNASKPPCQ